MTLKPLKQGEWYNATMPKHSLQVEDVVTDSHAYNFVTERVAQVVYTVIHKLAVPEGSVVWIIKEAT